MSETSNVIRVMPSPAKIHYVTDGPEAAIPVLLLHGASFSAATWTQTGTIAALAAARFRVIAVDLPGAGSSEYDSVDKNNWLAKFLDVTKIDRPIVVAPSAAGQYALPLATIAPQRIRGLVAVDMMPIPQFQRQLSQITAPVLAIWGAKDRMIPITHADLLVGAVANGKKVVISGAGHAPYLENAEVFHQALIEFLTGIRGK